MPENPPEISEVLDVAVEARTANWHTGMPGIVESYDEEAERVKVLPSLKQVDPESGEATNRPVLVDVPVLFPTFGSARVVGELGEGDVVWLAFSSRALTEWKRDITSAAAPTSPRRFSLADAVAFPGFATGEASVELRFTRDGKLSLGSGSVDVIEILSQLLEALAASTAGGDPLSNAATFTTLKTSLDTLKVP